MRHRAGPADPDRSPRSAGAIDYEAELAVVIGKGGRDIRKARRPGPCLRLHHRQRRDRPRRAGPPQAVADRQVARHLLPDGAVARQPRRARPRRHARALLGQRRAAPGRQYDRDLIFDIPTLIETISAGITLHARRRHRHRHAGRRRHRLQAAEVPQPRRRGAHRDRRHRRAREPGRAERGAAA